MKKLGDITKYICKITKPMTMDIDLELKDLNLILGQNGAGKSLTMVLQWVLSLVAADVYIMSRAGAPANAVIELAQYALDNCLRDHELDGVIGLEFTSGCSLRVTAVMGQVISVESFGITDLEEQPTAPVFLSAGLRTFDDQVKYLAMRKQHSGDIEKIVTEMVKVYKLYEVLYMERLIARFPIRHKQMEIVNTMIKGSFDYEIEEVRIDLDKPDFLARKVGEIDMKSLCTYGAGEQSVISMGLALA